MNLLAAQAVDEDFTHANNPFTKFLFVLSPK